MGALLRAAAVLAPGWAARRMVGQAQLQAARLAQARYEAAVRGRRTAGWSGPHNDAVGALRGNTLPRLRALSADLVRNNLIAKAAVDRIVSNAVGPGVIPRFSGADAAETAELEALARAHLDTTEIDADGMLDLYGLQDLAMRTIVERGAALLVRIWTEPPPGSAALPYRVRVLEPDHIDLDKTADLEDGGRIVQGVEFAADGQRAAYWLFPRHPWALDRWRRGGGVASVRVPAADVAHLFDVLRPGQVHGVPWLAGVMTTLQDLADYADAQLMRQKIAAVFAAFLQDSKEDMGSPIMGGEDTEGLLPETLEPGTITRLPPGRSIVFGNPPGVDGYGEYMRTILQSVAAALGITYEALTGNLGGVNFTSGRMGWQEMARNVRRWQERLLIQQMGGAMSRWFTEAAHLSRRLRGPVHTVWTPQARMIVDPAREVPAIRDAVRSGLMTPSEAVASMGRDPDRHFEEYADDLALLDRLGIVLDSDPRRMSGAGQQQPAAALAGAADNTVGVNDG